MDSLDAALAERHTSTIMMDVYMIYQFNHHDGCIYQFIYVYELMNVYLNQHDGCIYQFIYGYELMNVYLNHHAGCIYQLIYVYELMNVYGGCCRWGRWKRWALSTLN